MTPRTRAACAWTLAALLGWVSARAEDAREAPPFHSEEFEGSRSCAPCHPRQYIEWRGSAHAYALADPVYHTCSQHAFRQTEGRLGDHCIRCHGPVGTRSGELSPIFEPDDLSEKIREGVSCEVCHRMERPAHGGPVADANFHLRPEKTYFGRLYRPQANPAHENAYSDYLAQSESCGSCHDVVLHGMEIENSFAEWKETVFRERGVECQDCHMLRYSGQAAVGGPLRETLRRHNFPGVSLPPPGFPNRGAMQEEVGAFLKTALRVGVRHPEAAEAGAPFPITVVLKNAGTAHNFPSASFRQLWIEVTVRDGSGRTLFRTGHLDANGDLMDRHSELRPGADPALVNLSDTFVDDDGRETPYWFSTRSVTRSLRSLEERNIPYRIPVPADLEGGTIRATVRVLFRSFRPYQLRRFGRKDLADELPIWELDAYRTDDLPVLAEVPRRTDYRMPGDFWDIAEAVETLRDGDRLVVAPGRYLVRGALDFRGKRIELRSLHGPLNTTIAYDPSIPDAERSSVAVFQGGEDRGTVLEGFTLEGGTGTLVGGIRRGGGVYIAGSSPTVMDNRIVACGSAGGVGGGIAWEGGDPRIEGNRIVSSWAALGGGIAVRGDPGASPILHGNTLEGNVARRGGGIYVDAGTELRVERTTIAGCLALESGGGLQAAEGSSLIVDHATIVFNRTVGSRGSLGAGGTFGAEGAVGSDEAVGSRGTLGSHGALGADPARPPTVTNSILWGNEPGGADADLRWCLVDFECPDFVGRVDGYPLFIDATGAWETVPARDRLFRRFPPELSPPSWEVPRRWRGGDYGILPGSPAVDAGDPRFPADPDDTRTDLGAAYREQPLRAFVRGDVDGDGLVTWKDVPPLVLHLLGGEEPGCLDAADIDDGATVDPIDAVLLMAYLLVGRPAIPPPFPRCGIEPTHGDGLSCLREAEPCRR